MVDWKVIPKIDAHIHLTPNDVIEANLDCDGIMNGSVHTYEAIMEENHIECAFIMPYNDPYMMSMDFTVEAVHRNMEQMISTKGNRFACFADIDIRNDIATTLCELDRVLKIEGFLGIKLHPTNAGYPIDGDYYDQIFKYASDNGILVEIHSYPREHLLDDVCSPTRIKRIAAKYPNLGLSIAHLGGFQYEELVGIKAYFNLSAILPDIVKRFGIEKSNVILRSFGVERLVFATDYPESRNLDASEIYDRYFDILGQMDFTKEEAEMICKDNAVKMLGLKTGELL